MSLTKSIGKNTLGGGKKMNINLRTYNRSTHDLSYIWRNTQAPGTLVPFMCELGLPGDTWDIDFSHNIMTHPTIGPLFGSFKFQADVFVCPIRLYNALLHNNALNIGLDMSTVKLPKIEALIRRNITGDITEEEAGTNKSSLLNYLGIAGFGTTDSTKEIRIKKNITAGISYYDIFKNYYANKQEEYFYTIQKKAEEDIYIVTKASTNDNWSGNSHTGTIQPGGFGIFVPEKYNDKNKENIIIYYHASTDGVNTDIIYASTLAEVLENDGVGIDNQGAYINNVPQKGTVYYNISSSAGSFIIDGFALNEYGLSKYKLEEIDETRDLILKSGKEEFVVKYLSELPKYLRDLTNPTIGSISSKYVETTLPFKKRHEAFPSYTNDMSGLCVKTFQSDVFTNWINTEWIDGENGINAITSIKIDPEKNSFQLDTLNLAKKVYDMLNRIAVSGGTYQDWIETVYTNNFINRTETPVYVGGFSAEVEFQEVISNSATEEEPLGTLAGRGKTSGQKGGHVIVKIDEPSYIIGICSLTPRVDYCQGNRFDTSLDSLDDLHKPQLDAIGFQDRMAETLNWQSVYFDEEGNKINGSIGKQPAWIDYMTNFNKTFGNFAKKDNEAFMVLNRYFETDAKEQTIDSTSYINPENYNYIFADTDINSQNFWIQIGVFAKKVRRVMSAKVIPNL